MAAQDYAGVFTNVDSMLSNLTAWQSICCVDNATDASKRIHWIATEEQPDNTLAPCIVLDITDDPTRWKVNQLHAEATIEIRVELAVPPEECDTLKTQAVWVLTQYGALKRGMNAAFRESAALMVPEDGFQTSLLPGYIDKDKNQGRTEWNFIFRLPVVVI